MPRRHTWNVKENIIATIQRIYGVPVSVHRPTTRSPSRPWCIKHTLWVQLKQVTFLFHKSKLKRAYLNISVLQLPVTISCFLCHADVSFLLDPTFPPTNNACAAKGTLFYSRHLNMNLIHFLLFWQVDFFRAYCHPSILSSIHVSDWPHLSSAMHFHTPFPYTTSHLFCFTPFTDEEVSTFLWNFGNYTPDYGVPYPSRSVLKHTSHLM